jgi:short-subunit dehydrogenase
MSINYLSLFKLSAIAIASLPFFLLLDRWSREQGYELRGKNILITGGSRGLGLVMARQLQEAGAHLAICARDEAELRRARTDLEKRGGEVLALTCDVTEQTHVQQMIQQVRTHFASIPGSTGAIDVLINNAGADIISPIENLTTADYDALMRLHFWAPLYTMYEIFPEMQARRSGRIVNIASIGGKHPSPHMVAYCASKYALVGLSQGVRTELAKDGISVTTVCPGFVHTGIIDRATVKGQNKKEFVWFGIGDSLPLASASAEKVADAAIAGFRRGAVEVVVPLSSWFMTKIYGLFPELTNNVFALFNLFLPKPGGIGEESAIGKDSRPDWLPDWTTYLSNRAAQRNNELPAIEPEKPDEVKPVATLDE